MELWEQREGNQLWVEVEWARMLGKASKVGDTLTVPLMWAVVIQMENLGEAYARDGLLEEPQNFGKVGDDEDGLDQEDFYVMLRSLHLILKLDRRTIEEFQAGKDILSPEKTGRWSELFLVLGIKITVDS